MDWRYRSVSIVFNTTASCTSWQINGGRYLFTGVALGYLNAQHLTDEKFFKNPFAPGRAYRTGDVFKQKDDGSYVFVRRIDDQVKIDGFRIELAEIEGIIFNFNLFTFFFFLIFTDI